VASPQVSRRNHETEHVHEHRSQSRRRRKRSAHRWRCLLARCKSEIQKATLTHMNSTEEFADDLKRLIMHIFFFSYFAHANGMSETELIIDYDIEAAYNNTDMHVQNSCRRTIKSACDAVDEGVPYNDAHGYLNEQLDNRIKRLLAKQSKDHAVQENHAR
jgi:hypothetical protein